MDTKETKDAKNEFPKLLYKCPGPYKAHDGHTHDQKHVKTQEEEEAFVKKGWHTSLEAAVEAAEAKASSQAAPSSPVLPPKGK